MKRLLSLGLAALLTLAACTTSQEETPATAETPQAAETAPAASAETALPAVKTLYSVSYDFHSPYFNTGEECYTLEAHRSYVLAEKIDYATATKQVLCSVPGCTHDSEACPAWLPGTLFSYKLFGTPDAVYVYKAGGDEQYLPDWDSYYRDNVEPYLYDETTLQGMTTEEFVAYHRNSYNQRKLPACLFVLSTDGSAQQRIDLSEDIIDGTMDWCDGTALYGYVGDVDQGAVSQGYRVNLADGQVTTFPLLENEIIKGTYGNQLLTLRLFSPIPLSEILQEPEAYLAALQNSNFTFSLLDPATGTRTKLLDRSYFSTSAMLSEFMANGYDGRWGDWFVFSDYQHGESNDAAICVAYRAYDGKAQTWQDLFPGVNVTNSWLVDPSSGALPAIAEKEERYLWLLVYPADGGDAKLMAEDRMTGQVYEIPRQEDTFRLPVVALTDDGRFVVRTAMQMDLNNYTYNYALIDAEAFLQGSTDYTPVTEE